MKLAGRRSVLMSMLSNYKSYLRYVGCGKLRQSILSVLRRGIGAAMKLGTPVPIFRDSMMFSMAIYHGGLRIQ